METLCISFDSLPSNYDNSNAPLLDRALSEEKLECVALKQLVMCNDRFQILK